MADDASSALFSIRRSMRQMNDKVHNTLNAMVNGAVRTLSLIHICARIKSKRQCISKGGYRTKADAIAAGTKAKAEYDNAGRIFRPSEISVADYMDYWYKNYVCKHLKYNTQLSYERVIRLHIKPALGKYRLASLERCV